MAKKSPQTKRLSFTKKALESLPPPAHGRTYVYDAQTPGLAISNTAAGSKVFYFYKWTAGRPVRYRIGRFPEISVEQARRQAQKLTGAIAEGRDPQAVRRSQRQAPTLQHLFDHWLAHAKLRKRTWHDDQRQFDKYLDRLKNRKLTDITPADVAAWHTRIGREHGPYQANRARALLSAMFNKAHEIGHTGPNPCENVKRFKEESRERFLQADEFRPFFEALKEEPPLWRDFWLLCLFSGGRRGNVAAMAWQDLDLDGGVWYLPGRKTKADLPLAIVLPPPAVGILRVRRQTIGSDGAWVFPADSPAGHIIDPRKSWARILARSGIKDLRPHDLRRSLGSWQAIAGASLQVIGASLGHRDPKATAVYSRLHLDPVRASVNQAAETMVRLGKLTFEITEEETGGPDDDDE